DEAGQRVVAEGDCELGLVHGVHRARRYRGWAGHGRRIGGSATMADTRGSIPERTSSSLPGLNGPVASAAGKRRARPSQTSKKWTVEGGVLHGARGVDVGRVRRVRRRDVARRPARV